MKLVDLTHPLATGMAPFPGDPPFSIAEHSSIATHGCAVSSIVMGSHIGTHLDAMSHFVESGRSVDEMPLDWLYGPATVLRLPKARRQEITVEDLEPHEDSLTEGARIVVETGWHREFGKTDFYTDFPSLTVDAAQYLACRRIRMLGLDTPTPSREWLMVHRILLGTEIVVVESLANLDRVPDQFVISALPLKLVGVDGSPIRAVGIVPGE